LRRPYIRRHTGYAWVVDFDAGILGGGSAGYAAARTLAAAGWKVAIVDGADELGGLCILRGCMPTKALLHAAELRHSFESARVWGIEAKDPSVDWARMYAHKNAVIQDFAAFRRGQLLDGRFALIRSNGRFQSPTVVTLANGREISARHWLVATGSVVSRPPAAVAAIPLLTSDLALDLAEPPESLVVLGGGPVALEFAQFFARFGVTVTILQRSGQVLRDADEDVARELEKGLRREGIAVHTGVTLKGARVADVSKLIEFETSSGSASISAAAVFHGLGRRPNTADLGLEAAGVQVSASGRILVDAGQRTGTEGIYAAGDCCGPHEIVHIAIQQGETAAWNMLHPEKQRILDDRLLLSVVFTDPEVAQAGLTEKAAAAQGRKVAVATYPFNDHGKSIILGAQEGFVKLIVDAATREIVGAACVGPRGGELIHEVAVAMAGRMTAGQFAAVPHYHPTLAEIWTYPAEELAG
jgi:pyruvate/2-oxoglutarate dehydrogenase complex dihydrolipoamide dehydrogenase (E3) component